MTAAGLYLSREDAEDGFTQSWGVEQGVRGTHPAWLSRHKNPENQKKILPNRRYAQEQLKSQAHRARCEDTRRKVAAH